MSISAQNKGRRSSGNRNDHPLSHEHYGVRGANNEGPSRPSLSNNGHDDYLRGEGLKSAAPEEKFRRQGEIRGNKSTSPSGPSQLSVNGYLDVATVVGLAEWVHESVSDIGRQSTQEVVEIYDVAGHLTTEIKEVLLRFVSLNGVEDPQEQVEMESLVMAILKLDRILGGGADAAAVLSLLITKEG